VVRTWRGLTQAQLAERAGTHRTTIVRLESGTCGGTIATLLRVAAALQVPPEDLLVCLVRSAAEPDG